MSDTLYQLAYVSAARPLPDQAGLMAILDTARRCNAEADLTGLLLYRDGTFVQVLEGPQSAVERIYARIRSDHRHERVTTLYSEAITARHFPDWRMGFVSLHHTETRAIEGVSDFLTTPLTPESLAAEPSRARRLLLRFKLTP